MYKPEYFILQELVPQHVYEERGEAAWELLDEVMLITLDALRNTFGRIVVNNWHKGGERQWSGYRSSLSPVGSEYSQHRSGRAADCLFLDADVDFVRQSILDNPNAFPLITSVELDTSWLHFDVRNCERIKTYSP